MKQEKDYAVEQCENTAVHHDVIEAVRIEMADEDTLYDLAELFKVFGDSTRTKILSALFVRELCVCDIAALLGMTKSAVSHQLRILRQTKLVKARRNGKEVYYSLDDDHVGEIFRLALTHLQEEQ